MVGICVHKFGNILFDVAVDTKIVLYVEFSKYFWSEKRQNTDQCTPNETNLFLFEFFAWNKKIIFFLI